MLPDHEHGAATLCFVVDGSFEEKLDARMIEGSKGTLIYRPAGATHSDRFLSDRTVTFALDLASEIAEYGPSLPQVVSSPKTAQLVRQLYRESIEQDPFSSLAVASLLLSIQDELALVQDNNELRPPGWLRRVHDRLESQESDFPSLEELAASANVHPMHLTRVFRKFYGCSVGQYQRGIRLERCSHLLKTTNLSIGEIAITLGFCDQAHFIRAFRAKQGCTPRQFRES